MALPTIPVPTWDQTKKMDDSGEAMSPLDLYVYLNEPTAPNLQRDFRISLQDLIDWVVAVTTKDILEEYKS